jgi:hypothetical protein
MLLEANARPGLAIQIANGRGLVPRLEAIDERLDRPRTVPLVPALQRREQEQEYRKSA